MVIVDADRRGWSALDATARALDEEAASAATKPGKSEVSGSNRCSNFPEFITALELFLAAFASNSRPNQLAVFAYDGIEGGYLFPDRELRQHAGDSLRPAAIKQRIRAGLMQLRYGRAAAEAALTADGFGWAEPDVNTRYGSLGSCLSLALCYAHKQRKSNPKLSCRIIVFQASSDVPAQYISVINGVYSAQRLGIPIDSCLLNSKERSVFLQQAAYLTAGQHLRPDPAAGHHASLLQYFIMLLLPDARTRSDMLLPPQHDVNLRAHCFCHKEHKSVAWLCYVCLSIWCKAEPVCPTCGTKTGGVGAPGMHQIQLGGAVAGAGPPPTAAAAIGAGPDVDMR